MALSVMLVGTGGVGKSFLSSTSPGPILVADLEGSGSKLPRKADHVHWSMEDVKKGKYPSGLTDKSIVLVVPQTYSEWKALLSPVASPASPFVSYWTDSASVLTRMGEVEIVPTASDGRQGYGKLLRDMEPVFAQLKRLTQMPNNKLEVLGVTAWLRDDKQAPSMQGNIGVWFNQVFDMVGYVSIAVIDGKLGQRVQVHPAPKNADPRAKGTVKMLLSTVATEGCLINPNFAELNEMEKSD